MPISVDPAVPHARRRRPRRLVASLAIAATAAAGLTVALAPAASAHPAAAVARAGPATSALVVKEAVRGKFGKILTTTKGLSLYEHPGGPCTGSCLTVWPPLLMPKGTTTPTGAKGLGTVKVSGGRLQVTYNKQPLYTFVSDSGTSVKGNGVAGFVVAKVS